QRQGVKAKVVNDSRDTSAVLDNEFSSVCGKKGISLVSGWRRLAVHVTPANVKEILLVFARVAGCRKPVIDVTIRLLGCEGIHVRQGGNALLQLQQARAG